MLTYKEEPCKTEGHYTCGNAVQGAATCACIVHIHQEPESYKSRSDGPKSQSLCKLGICKQLGFLSALCHWDRSSDNHPGICEVGLPWLHTIASTIFYLQFYSTSLAFSAIKKFKADHLLKYQSIQNLI